MVLQAKNAQNRKGNLQNRPEKPLYLLLASLGPSAPSSFPPTHLLGRSARPARPQFPSQQWRELCHYFAALLLLLPRDHDATPTRKCVTRGLIFPLPSKLKASNHSPLNIGTVLVSQFGQKSGGKARDSRRVGIEREIANLNSPCTVSQALH